MINFRGLALATALSAATAKELFQGTPITMPSEIRADSAIGQKLLSRARNLDNNGAVDFSFVSSYAIKFQGCHHISQWNEDQEDEDDVRILTKRLVRFRLCPLETCENDKTGGCSSKYGDYVVDLNTFVEAYLTNKEYEVANNCGTYGALCEEECENASDNDGCIAACYDAYGMKECYDGVNYDFDPLDYAYCAQYDFRRRALEGRQLDDAVYYMGPYCADQGGEVHMGLFNDETCTSFSYNGESYFYSMTGAQLPYSDDSLISNRCISCYDDANDGMKQMCNTFYQSSGKCETKMSVDYPNESACTYIEGVKIIRNDGVIQTSSVKKSKPAAVAIGFFTTISILLVAYVYYLRTKLKRAQINLSGSGLT